MSSRCHLWTTLFIASCATTPPAQPTRPAPLSPPRPGIIASVEKFEEPPPTSSAGSEVLLGLMVGGLVLSGLLLPHGTGAIVGAEDANSAIAAPGGTSSTLPRYQVVVRFDDGGTMTLVYTNEVAFHPGERVVLAQQGLVAAETARSGENVQ